MFMLESRHEEIKKLSDRIIDEQSDAIKKYRSIICDLLSHPEFIDDKLNHGIRLNLYYPDRIIQSLMERKQKEAIKAEVIKYIEEYHHNKSTDKKVNPKKK